MLVLTRREGEAITIGEGIQITVVRLHKHRVQLGIAAPASVQIQRQELRERAAREDSLGSAPIILTR